MNNESYNAEEASLEALNRIKDCVDSNQSFLLEAGAGAGKTYSLVHSLKYIIQQKEEHLTLSNQKVACITFTNVAKREIQERIDSHPVVFVSTIHSFCWSLISSFRNEIIAKLSDIPEWQPKLEGIESITTFKVVYSDGFRRINDDEISLHHDDIIPITISFLQNEKFVKILRHKFPVILIDEYQDTDHSLFEAIKTKVVGNRNELLLGLFGDSWQKIYNDGCGKVEDPRIIEIGKNANFRSVESIVEVLNRLRPDLIQYPEIPGSTGEINIYHTNSWEGERRTGAGGGHWKGDLPEINSKEFLDEVQARLSDLGWDFNSSSTKVLMLTHSLLAREQGYPSIARAFRYNESFVKKDNKFIAYFADVIENIVIAFNERRYGDMFSLLRRKFPHLKSANDKEEWAGIMNDLIEVRENGTIGEVLAFISGQDKLLFPEKLARIELELREHLGRGNELSRSLREYQTLKQIRYVEMINLAKYLGESSPFATKHGVKGEEYENVLVVIGRGWNQYNFDQMLNWFGNQGAIPNDKIVSYEKNRNLFYVSCSRAKKNLSILFTTHLSEESLNVIKGLFGSENVEDLSRS